MWTTKSSIGSKGKPVFLAKEVIISYGQHQTVVQKEFRKRWKAKDWCYKGFCRITGKEFQSLHYVSERKRELGKNLQKKLKKSEEKKKVFKLRKTVAFRTVGRKRKIIKRRNENGE